jgi:hypothetical protein
MRRFAFFIVSLSIFLSGCLATTNLLVDGGLDLDDLAMANEMAERTRDSCTRYSERQDGSNRSGDIKMKSLPEVKAFFRSDNGWYKAETLNEGVWDSVFLRRTTQQFVCGQKNWDSYPESLGIQFKRVGVKEKSLEDVGHERKLH